MPSINQKEASALCMEHLVDHDWHGYTWDARWGDGEGVCPVETPIGTCYVEQGDRDCSSAVISSYEAAGISCGGATYTGNMKSLMLATGNFRAHRMSDGYNCDDNYIAQRGDCYLNESDHTAMCISAVPDMLAEFSINEFGGVYGGQTGDQTGWESHRAEYYGYPWEWCLEVIVDAEPEPAPAPEPSGSAVRYRVSIDSEGREWYDEMRDGFDTGGTTDDFGGDMENDIRWLACDAKRYRVCTQDNGWLPWVDQYNIKDLDKGCAGDGTPIIGWEIDDPTVRHAAHANGKWFDDMIGMTDTGNSDDTYAGDLWHPIDAVRMRRA